MLMHLKDNNDKKGKKNVLTVAYINCNLFICCGCIDKTIKPCQPKRRYSIKQLTLRFKINFIRYGT